MPRDPECVPVHVDRVVLHGAEIEQPDADALAVFADHGVVYGPLRPLIVCQFQSIFIESATVWLGPMKKFWKSKPKSRSTGGSKTFLGCTIIQPTMPKLPASRRACGKRTCLPRGCRTRRRSSCPA